MASKVLGIAGEKAAGFTLITDKETVKGNGDIRTVKGLDTFKSELLGAITDYGKPDLILCDMHPDLLSTKLACDLGQSLAVKVQPVRHHHAHIAAVLAENGTDTGFGLALDGFGLGENNQAWGGELLYVCRNRYIRLGRLAPLKSIGGDKATLETWRLEAAFLYDNFGANAVLQRFPNLSPLFIQALNKNICTIETSSCGRLFDLAVCLAQIKGEDSLAKLLTFTAAAAKPAVMEQGYNITVNNGLYELDLTPLLLQALRLRQGFPDFFHGTLAAGLADMAAQAVNTHTFDTSCTNTENKTIPNVLALSGGCLLNGVLKKELNIRLKEKGFKVLNPVKLPPSDESVSFGMAHIGLYI